MSYSRDIKIPSISMHFSIWSYGVASKTGARVIRYITCLFSPRDLMNSFLPSLSQVITPSP